MFVTSEGHPYAVFRRAIDRRNLAVAWATASELRRIALADALALLLLVRERDPPRFERVALRWHARYCAEIAGVTFADASAVLSLLEQLGGNRGAAAANALQALFEAGGERSLAAEVAAHPVNDERQR